MKRGLLKAATSLALILLIALGARVAYAWNQEHKLRADLVGLVPFLNETGNIAFSLAKGHGFSSPYWQETGPTAWLTPVYPALVAAIFKIFGIHAPHSFFAIVFLNILFSTATCVPLFYIGKRVGGLGVASGAAWLWAIFPNAIMIPYQWVWDTSLAALLMVTILWATLELADKQSVRAWCGYGLLWGFALMTNPSLGTVFPLLLGWAAYRAWQKEQLHLSRPLLACAIAVMCCVPWTVRNYLAFHRFIPLRSNLPFELWLGNNEQFDGLHAGQVAESDRFYARAPAIGNYTFRAAVCGHLDGGGKAHRESSRCRFAAGAPGDREQYPSSARRAMRNSGAAALTKCLRFSDGRRADCVPADLLRDAHFAPLQAPD
jgi:4-amino-4-deoxy-L-arabinose transferase-like glycosyltransferase